MISKSPVHDDGVHVYPQPLIESAYLAKSLSLRRGRIRSKKADAYLSAFKGRGMEYDESRLYHPGDDVRHLDWRVTARTGKAHTKLFREERERPVYLWVDYRASMFFATRGCYKSVKSAQIAALLAWSAVHESDRVGGIVFSEYTHREVKPKRGKNSVLRIIRHLSHFSEQDERDNDVGSENTAVAGSLSEAFSRLSCIVRPGSLVFLISDFRGLDSSSEPYLRQFAVHSETVFIHVYDPLESSLPPPGEYRLSGGEYDFYINTGDADYSQAYVKQFEKKLRYLESLARNLRIGLIQCRTFEDPFSVLRVHFGVR